MKSKGILITVIVLLSVWSVIATVGFVSAEKDNRLRLAKYSMVKSSYEDKEEAYDKLKTKYDELEAKYEEYNDMYYSEQSTRIVYEWMLDVCANQGNESYDSDLSLERILRREYPWLNMEIVDEQEFAVFMSVTKERAKIILLKYDMDIEIE